jgi:anaerobic ribonucleoside-triphosphate reductase
MMSDNRPLLCAKCGVNVQVVPDPKPEDMVTCPQCGESDTFENVKRSLGQQAAEWAQRKLAESFKGKSGFTYTEGPREKREHRFILQFD